jgi:hypothetical protein
MEETKFDDPFGDLLPTHKCTFVSEHQPIGDRCFIDQVREKQNQVYDQYKQDTTTFKTSHDWYKLTSVYKNLILPDGWTSLPDCWPSQKNPKFFWHKERISFSDYLKRANMSTFVMPGHRLFGKELYIFGESLSASDYVNTALSFAIQCHEGQTLKDGITPYIEHTLGVGKLIREFVPSSRVKRFAPETVDPSPVVEPFGNRSPAVEDFSVSELMIAAYLFNFMRYLNDRHTVLSEYFGKKIADLLQEVYIDNEDIKKMGKKDYFMYKMQHMSVPGLILTYCERLDNWGYGNEENKKIVGKNNMTEIQDLISTRRISGIGKYILEKLALAFFQSDDVMMINGIRKL